jgi:hypothetical protein
MKNLENLLVENSGIKVICNGGESDNDLFEFVNKLVDDYLKNKVNTKFTFYDSFWRENAKKLISSIALSLIYNASWNKRLGKVYKEEVILNDIISNLGGENAKKKYLYLAGLSNKNNNLEYIPQNCYENKGFFKHFGSKMSLKNEKEDIELRTKIKKVYQKKWKIEYIENGIHPYIAKTLKELSELDTNIIISLEQFVKTIIKGYTIKFSNI